MSPSLALSLYQEVNIIEIHEHIRRPKKKLWLQSGRAPFHSRTSSGFQGLTVPYELTTTIRLYDDATDASDGDMWLRNVARRPLGMVYVQGNSPQRTVIP